MVEKSIYLSFRNVQNTSQQFVYQVKAPPLGTTQLQVFGTVSGQYIVGQITSDNPRNQRYQSTNEGPLLYGHLFNNYIKVYVTLTADTGATITLKYKTILQRRGGFYQDEDLFITSHRVEAIDIFYNINSVQTLLDVSGSPLAGENFYIDGKPLVDLSLSAQMIRVSSLNTLVDHTTASYPVGVAARFAIKFDVNHKASGEILVQDNIFVHTITPDAYGEPTPADVLFLLSAPSKKWKKQLEIALEDFFVNVTTVEGLNYHIIASDEISDSIDSRLNAAGVNKSVDLALSSEPADFISTSILNAIAYLNLHGSSNSCVIILIVHSENEPKYDREGRFILKDLNRFDKRRCAVISVALGDFDNFRVLETISTQRFGFARKILNGSDAHLELQALFSEVDDVAMTDVRVNYKDHVNATFLSNTKFPLLFNGSEVVVCARLQYLQRSDYPLAYNVKGLKPGNASQLVSTTQPGLVVKENALCDIIQEHDKLTEQTTVAVAPVNFCF
ncbi:inter-alpha-trypsin inhibitor heavy chain H4 [Elysia marginata]|uniref:Inter-alpha-trypsin inhibitor heavy chain H4 n=1 Tax=Elysia marginata TaxID=1093978 RepID=A0AAV4JFG7_9GAST|nr:inter-alpha-trypsin inhibitor heavy chain H4 [Elysia marginata]